MRISKKIREGSARVTRAALAGVLALGLAPLPAFASDLTTGSIEVAPQADAMSADGQIIAAAYAAANPAPEILGLDNPNQRDADEAEKTYNFFGDPDINTNPDPYLYNHHNKLTPGITIGGRQGSPMSALANYVGGGDYTTNPQDAVWELLPHIILGTGSDNFPNNDPEQEHDFYADNARKVEKARGLDADSYNPVAVTYNRNNLPTMIQTMYRLAAAANEVSAADSSLSARYGDPMEIAQNYERYILGQKGLVKQAIDTGKVKMKTIALVSNYDSSAKTYTIITDGVAEGTATTNRYLEAVQGVANNYYDTVGALGASGVTAQQLKDNVDVIIIGGQASMDSTALAGFLQTDGLLDKTFYCTNWAYGSAFGTTVNSVENAQNIGRILPCVYPEVLDQSDMIAYYYETFYHLKTGSVASVMAERMDGVRNWAKTDSASYTNWEVSDYTGYVHDDVQAKLVEGVSYLNSQSGLSDYLTPTGNVDKDVLKVNLENATVTVSAGILEDGKAEPEPTVKYGASTLAKDVDYTVSYTDNTTVGATGTVTVTAVDGSNYEGSNSATFKVIESDNFSALEASLDGESFTYTTRAIEPAVSVKDGVTALVQGTDYTVAYSNNVKAAASDAEAAPTATISGIGNYAGTITKTFSITKAEPKGVITANKSAYVVGDAVTLTASVDSVYTKDGGTVDALAATSSNEDVVKLVTTQGPRGSSKAWTVVGPGEATISLAPAATDNCEAPEINSVTITATIDLSGASVKKFDSTYAYSGEAIAISPSVTVNDVKLTQGADFDVVVKQNGQNAEFKEMGVYDVAIVGKGSYSGTIEKKIEIVPYFTVYLQTGDDEAVAKKVYNTADEFAALKSASSDPVSALFYAGNNWSVATAATYVTLDDLLSEAGISDSWAAGSTISYDGKSGKNANVFTYEQIQAMSNFYPSAQQDKSNTDKAAVNAPFVFSLTEFSAATNADNDAEAVQTANVSAANNSNTPRAIFGVSEADYKDPGAEGAQVAGQRLWSNLTSITITVPTPTPTPTPVDKADNPMTVAAANPKAITFSAKAQVIANPLTVSKAQGAVTYAKASGDAKFTVNATTGKITVAKNTPAGTYNVGITTNAAGNDSYKAASKTQTVKITVKKAANTLKTKAGKANLKLETLKKKAQTIKPAAVAKAVVKTAGKGTTTYAKKSVTKKYKKYVSVTKKGKVAVKKGAPKGKCVITLNVKSAGNGNYNAKTQTAKLTITIK